jgi:outer membrane protein TolC
MNKILVPLSLLFALCSVQAQGVLTADESVSIALKNNYDILVAHNDAELAKVNNTPGNAGMLPSIAATGSEAYYGGQSVLDSNALSNAASAAVSLSWTLFDGGKMFVTKHKLGELEALGSIQFRDKVLQTAYSVFVAYFDVVRQKQQLESIRDVIAYNQEQVTILKTSFGAGLSPKTTFLQAQIDLNVFKENELAQESVIRDSKRTLNILLARNPDSAFEVTDSIPLTYVPDKSQLLAKIQSGNVDIAVFEKQVEVARLSLQEARSLFFPKLLFSAGYGISRTDNNVGPPLVTKGYGPQVGGSITIPLYQSGNVLRQVTTARLQLESSKIALESERQQIASQLSSALDEFENQRALLAIERDNDVLAKENLDISMQRLKLGESTSLELRQAQESYQDSRTRLINIEYNLKAAETKLKQLAAEL